jgi:hypothetical protein
LRTTPEQYPRLCKAKKAKAEEIVKAVQRRESVDNQIVVVG